MNILIVAENAVLPVAKYGGLHRMVWCLGSALAQAGHKVTFLCAKGSQCAFAHIIERDKSIPVEKQIPEDIDVVHFNTPVPKNFDKPYVDTIHGNFNKEFTHNSVFLSKDHAKRFGSDSYVYNGLDWDDVEYANADITRERINYHFLGKAAWRVKNVSGAISVVKHLPCEGDLDVIGGCRFNFHMGLRFTFSPRIHFHGMCGGEQKRNLLMQSKGLIFPVIWHEPFGLAVIESLYFGAPVFCTPYGALPEIVIPEVGYLSSNRAEMTDAIVHANYSAKICHEYARDTFNARRMAEGYLEKYEQVMNGKVLNPTLPKQIENEVKTIWTNN